MRTPDLIDGQQQDTFIHEALLYAGDEEFVDRMTAFIRGGLEADEPVLVVVIPPKIDALRSALGGDAREVLFADMAEIGRNPARIIPLWREFVEGHAGIGRVRGIGEPIWAGRTPEEITESQRHESLINLAFDGAPAWILCPYDTKGLDVDVIDEALRSHPIVAANGPGETSPIYRGLDAIAEPFDDPLPDPPRDAARFAVVPGTLDSLRRVVAKQGREFGLEGSRAHDLVLAVNEILTNTVRHAGGNGTLRLWHEEDRLVADIRDHGRISEPLAGRRAPLPDQIGGLGLWIVNQLCDLVQLRSGPAGSVVRLHMSRP